jgi:predicted secreted protein
MEDELEVKTGERFAVTLPENGPGGYLWRVAERPPQLTIVREDDLPPRDPAVGAAGSKLFELEASEPGTFSIRFERRRDWEPTADRERSIVITAR